MVLNTKLYRNHSYPQIFTTENSVSKKTPKYFSHKIKLHYQKVVKDRNLCTLMIARIAQLSFSKIENCLENTISKMCASTANQTDGAGQCPRPTPSFSTVPGLQSPLQPGALRVAQRAAIRTHHAGPVHCCVDQVSRRKDELGKHFYFKAVNASRDWVPVTSCGSSDEPGAFQELNENSVHERVLTEGLHQHHSLLP